MSTYAEDAQYVLESLRNLTGWGLGARIRQSQQRRAARLSAKPAASSQPAKSMTSKPAANPKHEAPKMSAESEALTARVREVSKDLGGDFHGAVWFTAAGVETSAAKALHKTQFGRSTIDKYDPSAELNSQEACSLLGVSPGNWGAMLSMGQAPKPDGSRGTFRTWKIGTLLSAVATSSWREPHDQWDRAAMSLMTTTILSAGK